MNNSPAAVSGEEHEVQYLYSNQKRRRRGIKPGDPLRPLHLDPLKREDTALNRRSNDLRQQDEILDKVSREIRASSMDVVRVPLALDRASRAATVAPSFRYDFPTISQRSVGGSLPALVDPESEAPRTTTPSGHLNPPPIPSTPHELPADEHDTSTVTYVQAEIVDWRMLPYAPPELVAQLEGNKPNDQETLPDSCSFGQSEQATALQPRPATSRESPHTSHEERHIIDLTQDPPDEDQNAAHRAATPHGSRQRDVVSAFVSEVTTRNNNCSSPMASQPASERQQAPVTPASEEKARSPHATQTDNTTSSEDHVEKRSATTDCASDGQPPAKKRRHNPWTSKMYADLVQQLQQSFPFREFARQHDRRPSEVLEVFSAIVQLPLFKHSSDARTRISFGACKGRLRHARALQQSLKAIHRDEEHRAKRRKQLAVTRQRKAEDGTRKKAGQQHDKALRNTAPRAKGVLNDAINGGVGLEVARSLNGEEVE